MKTREMTPFVSSTFSALTVTFIFVFENNQNWFSCGPPFGPFWSVKYLNVGQKLSIWTAHHTFLESRHPEVTKKPFMFCPQEEPKKGISSWTNWYILMVSSRSILVQSESASRLPMKQSLSWCTISSATAKESFTVNPLNVIKES